MAEIQFSEEFFGGAEPRRRALGTLHLDTDVISVGDLIRFRVESKVLDREPGPAVSMPLWLKEDARQAAPPPTLEQAIDDARTGLLTNAYFLIVNGRQVRDVEEKVGLNDVNDATFLRLMPLKGG